MNARVAATAVAWLLGCGRTLDLGGNLPADGSTASDAAPRDATSGDGAGPVVPEVDAGEGATLLALGGASACAMRGDEMACWGRADRGQLAIDPAAAHDDCAGIACQDLVAHMDRGDIARIAFGALHACALHTDGRVSCWGDNRLGQLGRGVADSDPHPTPIDVVEDARDLALGRFHGCALVRDGVVCWGLGEHGELGEEPTSLDVCAVPTALAADIGLMGSTARCATMPRLASAFAAPDALFAGGFATCGVTAGAAHCAGLNLVGQLGLGRGAPERVTTPAPLGLDGVAALPLGEHHGCAVLDDGSARCWGANYAGELGVGSVVYDDCGGEPCLRTPTPVSDLATSDALVTGRAHTCALSSNGAVRCWGSDARGQLGNSEMSLATCPRTPDGDVPCANRPVAVWDLDDAVVLAAGDDHTCAVRADGEVVCWGDNTFRQMAAPNAEPAVRPAPVYNLFAP